MIGYRPVLAGLVAGIAAGAGSYVLADWPTFAVVNGVTYFAAFGLLFYAYAELRTHVGTFDDTRASLWTGGLVVALSLGGTPFLQLLDHPLWESAAVLALVYGLVTAALATGIGTTVAYLESSGRLDTAPAQASAAERS